MRRLIFFVVCLFLTGLSGLSAAEVSTELSDEVLMLDVPVYIGEEQFIEKAQSRAEEAGRSQPFGLVLSGGAARAMAHLGVLKKMEEEGIVPDFIVANSMGAIIGLLYSAGMSCDDIYGIMTGFSLGELFMPQFPVEGGLLDTSRLISVLKGILGPLRIEDLKIPVAVIDEDLITRRQIVFQAGDVYDVIEGSIVIPMVFPPKEYMGYLLMDGGCTNIVPVDAAYKYTDKVAVSSTLYNVRQNLKNGITIINRMQDVAKSRAGIAEIKKHDNLVWLRNPVENFSFMGFDKSVEIMQIGYECASANMDALEDLAEISEKSAAAQAEFMKDRKAISDKISSYIKNYKKIGVVPLENPTPLFTLGISMLGEVPNDYFLNNYDYLFLGEELGYGTMRLNLREYWFPDNYGLDSALSFAAGSFIKSKSRALFDFKYNRMHNFYYYSNNEIITFSYDTFGLKPFCTFEGELDDDFDKDGSFHRIGLKGYVGENRFINFSAFGFEEDQEDFGVGATASLDQHLVWLLHLNEEATYRMPLPGSNSIRLYKNDGVRGRTTGGLFDHLLMARTTFYLKPDFTPSLAEAFIFSAMRLGVFADYYYFDDSIFTTGLSLDFDILFIGIMPVKVLCYAGWDFDSCKAFAKFAIGTEF